MLILAFESSAKSASTAVCDGHRLIGQYFQESGLTHSRTLLSMAQSLLQNLDMTVDDIEVIAVANGPGSFTGVRIGVSAAKGLAWGSGKPVCGVSTLFAMAHFPCPKNAVICPVMDARRGQIYNAKFLPGAVPERICDDRAIALNKLADEAKQDKKPYFLVGDGAKMCYNYFRDLEIDALLSPEPMRSQNAWGVAMAAVSSGCETSDNLVPNYLRLSQAERERLERLSRFNEGGN